MPILVTIGSTLFGLFGKKVTDTTAKLAGIAALVVLAILAVVLFFVIHDHNIIKNHDASANAKVGNEVISADRYAGQQKDARDQTFANSQSGVTAAIQNATAAQPEKTKQPVGPASQAYYDELRRQKGKK